MARKTSRKKIRTEAVVNSINNKNRVNTRICVTCMEPVKQQLNREKGLLTFYCTNPKCADKWIVHQVRI